jgi:protein-S-isoprenylcysteine O-methyltransferase Ste14
MKTTSAALAAPSTLFSRVAILAYSVTCYALGVSGLVWLILATLDVVPFTGGPAALSSTGAAITFNLVFVALFGFQHAIMARPAFKERWRRILPQAAERATFTLMAGLLMALAMWVWQPLPSTIWAFESPVLVMGLRGLCALGWAWLLAATFAIDHFELFGLKQAWRNFRGVDQAKSPFVMRLMYRFDRHPIMTGALIGLWATPVMRLDHLVLALGMTAYVVIGVFIEERTLVALHGDNYREYRRKVGALVPFPGKRK